MTKIFVAGPASGTGNYTLKAPVTADVLDFELPLVGTHIAGAQADGMPLGPGGDPVVESGSNTDGEWTRWADGTQQCWIDLSGISHGAGTLTGGIYLSPEVDTPFPITFISDPVGGINALPSVGYWAQGRALSSTTWRTRVYRGENFSGGDSGVAQLFATGRWK